jgi:predicted lipid-binding transport protein (Tim44 family)
MQTSIALGLLAGFAFLMTFNKMSGLRSFVIASLIVSLVAVGAESASFMRNRVSSRTYQSTGSK